MHCTQLFWMKCFFNGHGIEQNIITLYCCNISAINISKNPTWYSRTKYKDICRYFIQKLVEKYTVVLQYVPTETQVTSIFTKPIDIPRYIYFRSNIGVCIIE